VTGGCGLVEDDGVAGDGAAAAIEEAHAMLVLV
jgi:hypothetical protein